MPMTGWLEALKTANTLPIGNRAVERAHLDAGRVDEVVDDVLTRESTLA